MQANNVVGIYTQTRDAQLQESNSHDGFSAGSWRGQMNLHNNRVEVLLNSRIDSRVIENDPNFIQLRTNADVC